MRSDYAGMEEMLRGKEGLLRDADAFSASLLQRGEQAQ